VLVAIVTAFGLRSNQSRRVPDATDQKGGRHGVIVGCPKPGVVKLLQSRANWGVAECCIVAVLTPRLLKSGYHPIATGSQTTPQIRVVPIPDVRLGRLRVFLKANR
jgi:hypothetical protein